MAFIDFSQPLPALSPVSAARSIPAEEAGAFGREEWQVIALARRDGLSSLREPGLLARTGALIFGKKQNPLLASERLEALRRLSVEAWHRGYAVSLSALAAFRAAGFSKAQLELLLGAISASRRTSGRRIFA
jgi:hypothetical protein